MTSLAQKKQPLLVLVSDPDKDTLASCLNLYGMAHRNTEYHLDRRSYLDWLNSSLQELDDLDFTDTLDCYMKILKRLR